MHIHVSLTLIFSVIWQHWYWRDETWWQIGSDGYELGAVWLEMIAELDAPSLTYPRLLADEVLIPAGIDT